MATLIDMPKLSDTMTVGTLVKWLKNEGDPVASGDMIAEVETDKATMEVECFDDGVLIKQYCGVGDEVAVGGAIAAVGEAGEEAPAAETIQPQQPLQSQNPPLSPKRPRRRLQLQSLRLKSSRNRSQRPPQQAAASKPLHSLRKLLPKKASTSQRFMDRVRAAVLSRPTSKMPKLA